MRVEDFADGQPQLVPERYFAGELEGWGIVLGPFGRLRRQVSIHAQGRFDPQTGTLWLDEVWRGDDGLVDELRWTILVKPSNQYVGQEASLLEEAKGERAGNAFHWCYRRSVPQGSGDQTLAFDDWFWRIDERVVMARAQVSRFAIPVGALFVTYRRTEPEPRHPADPA